MFLHISFIDGSNPYLMYGDKKKLRLEIKGWKRNYDMNIRETPAGYYAFAAVKERTT